MSNTPQSSDQPAVAESSPVVESAVRNLLAEVKANLTSSGSTVRDRILNLMVEDEIQKRVKATTVVMDKLEALQAENRKVKPTFAGYTSTGAGVGEPLYTKEQAETLKKNKEQLDRLESALTKALANNDFSKVFELSR